MIRYRLMTDNCNLEVYFSELKAHNEGLRLVQRQTYGDLSMNRDSHGFIFVDGDSCKLTSKREKRRKYTSVDLEYDIFDYPGSVHCIVSCRRQVRHVLFDVLCCPLSTANTTQSDALV